MALPPGTATLPARLRAAGYATALIGKWHLGRPPHCGPLQRGYEEFFGPLGGGVDYFSHVNRSGTRDLYDGDREVEAQGYLTDLLSERAIGFVRRQAQSRRPFLLSLHYTAPHWPWQTRESASRSPRSLPHTDGGSIATYYRMIEQMDEGIGRVIKALRDGGLLDNTLVVFTSDNGGERFSDVWPFIGQKMDLLEGGIRVPLIASWPKRMPAGATTAEVAITMDWVATFLDAAGLPPEAGHRLDGISLLPALDGRGSLGARELYWRMQYRRQAAVRSGRWKFLRIGEHEYLFDLAADPRERANLAQRHPERIAELRRRFAEWEASMPPVPGDAQFHLAYTERDLPRGWG